MGEKRGSFRTTISVPGDLKARMARVKEPVNWSALACRAFEDKLAEIAARKENKAMTDVVERLRASLRDEQSESFNEGHEAGTKWAENAATPAQLKRLESFQKTTKTESQREWEHWFSSQGTRARWVDLVAVIQDNRIHRARRAQEFWIAVFGKMIQKLGDGDFLRGFVEGALGLWAKVQEQL
jgi:hypothetical protein